jgi:membrane associated rhomboid family serine protease
MARGNPLLARLTFGGRVPWSVGLLLSLTVITSLTVAMGSRHVLPLFELGAFVPARVLEGEIWRLVSWSVIEPSPLSLIFACLLLYWFGRDLGGLWGSRRFLLVYLGVALVAAVGTCLVALFDRPILEQTYVGSWPLAEALTVAWGLTFPDRIIRIYFVIPIRGYIIAWGTVGLTVLFALYSGWDRYVPNLLAEGTMLAWLYRRPVVARWSTWRRAQETAARKARVRAKEGQRMATVHVLRKIEAHDDDPPPLSPELEGKLSSLIEAGAKKKPKPGSDEPN